MHTQEHCSWKYNIEWREILRRLKVDLDFDTKEVCIKTTFGAFKELLSNDRNLFEFVQGIGVLIDMRLPEDDAVDRLLDKITRDAIRKKET